MSLTYPTKAGDNFKRLPIANVNPKRINAPFVEVIGLNRHFLEEYWIEMKDLLQPLLNLKGKRKGGI
ncbi:hypothetical protein ACQCVP_21500 [Rossellomorea vietnamensis]|uniref:hypothetical protein n=1 Tax=Rossellomorea vietnamensis TaxID=218284 RepID=UPI003CF05BC2